MADIDGTIGTGGIELSEAEIEGTVGVGGIESVTVEACLPTWGEIVREVPRLVRSVP